MTQDGSILIINCAYPGGRGMGVHGRIRSKVRASDDVLRQKISVEKNSGYSEAVGHPCSYFDVYDK